MNSNEMIGAVVIALSTLLGLMATLYKFVAQPTNNLNVSVVKLTAKIEQTDSNVSRIDARVSKHGERLDDHDLILARNNLK